MKEFKMLVNARDVLGHVNPEPYKAAVEGGKLKVTLPACSVVEVRVN